MAHTIDSIFRTTKESHWARRVTLS